MMSITISILTIENQIAITLFVLRIMHAKLCSSLGSIDVRMEQARSQMPETIIHCAANFSHCNLHNCYITILTD